MPYYPPTPYTPYYGAYRQPMSVRAILIITAVVLLLIVGVYFYMRKKILSSVEDELPSSTTGVSYTAEEDKQIRYLAISIKDDLSRYIQMGHDLGIYKELLSSSDRIFVGTARYYKQIAGESLRQSLTDSSGSFSWNFTDGTFGDSSDTYEAIMNRLNSLQVA